MFTQILVFVSFLVKAGATQCQQQGWKHYADVDINTCIYTSEVPSTYGEANQSCLLMGDEVSLFNVAGDKDLDVLRNKSGVQVAVWVGGDMEGDTCPYIDLSQGDSGVKQGNCSEKKVFVCQIEVDICHLFGDNCSAGGNGNRCVLVSKSEYRCECGAGFKPSDGSMRCENIDECLEAGEQPHCGLNKNCVDTQGSFVCACAAGFTESEDGDMCEDIRECEEPTTCDTNAICQDTDGGFSCTCKDGWTGSGRECREMTACDVVSCHTLAQCQPSTEQCECDDGYTGDGESDCSDMDECKVGAGKNRDVVACPEHSECENTNGSFLCHCSVGFQGFNSTVSGGDTLLICKDVDECLERIDHCELWRDTKCNNTLGSYVCHIPGHMTGRGEEAAEQTITMSVWSFMIIIILFSLTAITVILLIAAVIWLKYQASKQPGEQFHELQIIDDPTLLDYLTPYMTEPGTEENNVTTFTEQDAARARGVSLVAGTSPLPVPLGGAQPSTLPGGVEQSWAVPIGDYPAQGGRDQTGPATVGGERRGSRVMLVKSAAKGNRSSTKIMGPAPLYQFTSQQEVPASSQVKQGQAVEDREEASLDPPLNSRPNRPNSLPPLVSAPVSSTVQDVEEEKEETIRGLSMIKHNTYLPASTRSDNTTNPTYSEPRPPPLSSFTAKARDDMFEGMHQQSQPLPMHTFSPTHGGGKRQLEIGRARTTLPEMPQHPRLAENSNYNNTLQGRKSWGGEGAEVLLVTSLNKAGPHE